MSRIPSHAVNANVNDTERTAMHTSREPSRLAVPSPDERVTIGARMVTVATLCVFVALLQRLILGAEEAPLPLVATAVAGLAVAAVSEALRRHGSRADAVLARAPGAPGASRPMGRADPIHRDSAGSRPASDQPWWAPLRLGPPAPRARAAAEDA